MVAMGLATAQSALRVAYFTAAITFIAGIVGTAHHYYWYGGGRFLDWLGSRIFLHGARAVDYPGGPRIDGVP